MTTKIVIAITEEKEHVHIEAGLEPSGSLWEVITGKILLDEIKTVIHNIQNE